MSTSTSEIYAAALGIRNVELQTLWTRFNIHLLLNGGLVLGYVSQSNESLLRKLGVAPHLFGLLLTVAWLLSELAGRRTLHSIDARIDALEIVVFQGASLATTPVVSNHPAFFRDQSKVSLLVVLTFFAAWFYLGVQVLCVKP